jgi:RNA recognition motif-containing protein
VYQSGWVIPETTALIGLFSLGWFLAGLMIGQRLPRPPADVPRPRRQRGETPKPTKAGSVEIYVGNLPYDVTEKELRANFEEYGQVESIRLIENKFNGKSKGFGFVEMPDRREATAAIRALEGKEYKGRKLVVNEARSRARG